MHNKYSTQGITIRTNVLSNANTVSLTYDGILSKSGASDVYAHIGYGDNHNWQNTSFIKMDRTSKGFESTVKIDPVLNLNVVFKDSASNWDNNSGTNYVFNNI